MRKLTLSEEGDEVVYSEMTAERRFLWYCPLRSLHRNLLSQMDLNPDFKGILFALENANIDVLVLGAYAVAAGGWDR